MTRLDDELADAALNARVGAFLEDVEEGAAGPGPLPKAEFEGLIR